jgi:hypothetical protein
MSATEPQLAGCEAVGPALVHYSARGIARRIVFKCWTCEKRTPHVMKWDGAWYGTTDYCIVCLDGWQDGERMGRPFQRGWKKERAAYIKRLWDEAMLPERYHAWVHWDAHRATCHVERGCAECETRPS